MNHPKKTKRNVPKKPPEFLGRPAPLWLTGFERRELIAAFSLAHLLFLRVWADHLTPLENAYFAYTRHGATWQNVAGLWLAATVLMLPLAFALRACRTAKPASKQLASIGLTLVFAIQVVLVFNLLFKSDGDAFHGKNFFFSGLSADAIWILIGEAMVLLAWALLLHTPKVVAAVTALLLLLAPFPVLVSVNVLASAFAPASRALFSGSPAPRAKGLARTVVIVMDELDYQLVFSSDSALAEYPNFAALKKESLFGSQAFPPSQNTLLSLPSYWYGKNVSRISVAGRKAPEFQFFAEPNDRTIAGVPNLFAQAAAAGASTEIVGWSHPYCDLFSAATARCFQSAYQQGDNGDGVLSSAGHGIQRMVDVLSLAGFADPSFLRSAHLTAYQEFLRRSTDAVGNGQNDLVWLHLPVPHEPIIFDRTTKGYRQGGVLLDGNYFDNVALADATLGMLKARLQEAGLWNQTNLLLVSDHAYRHTVPGETAADQTKRLRVPFLLKVAGTTTKSLRFDAPFSTRVVGPLALALLSGQLSTASSVSRWLDGQRQADRTFLRAAYDGGKKRCVDYPFTSERALFELWAQYDPQCPSAAR